MGQLVIWPVNRNHPIWQSLSNAARLLFIDMATLVADGERTDLPDGFFLDIWIVHCRYLNIDLDTTIEELIARGILSKFDVPPGWQFTRWTERARVMRPTAQESEHMNLGQKSASYYDKQRRSKDPSLQEKGTSNIE